MTGDHVLVLVDVTQLRHDTMIGQHAVVGDGAVSLFRALTGATPLLA